MTVLPFLAVEIDETDVKGVYVVINEFFYRVPTVLKGLDVCFKSFIVFNLAYPVEADHMWLLLQRSIYKIETLYDKKPPIVMDILNKLEHM